MRSHILYLDYEDIVVVAARAIGARPLIRDAGLLASAVDRPRTTVFGEDAYPSIMDKAAALMESLARNHPLIDGNKRLALAGVIAFLGINGFRLKFTNDEAYEFTIAVATGQFEGTPAIAAALEKASSPRS